jgi:phosphoribosyl 1,2-cyclic phosphodiesterase
VRIRFWGTRGSIAAPGPSTVRYGGNTSCVELRSDSGTLVVFDCGTGARELGRALVAEAAQNGASPNGVILLGHTHWDHIQGLPFFEPLFGDAHWDIYGPRGLGPSLDQTLAGQMNYQYFPVALDQLDANITYHELVEGRFEIDDLVVHTQYLNHPALTLGYRIECNGAVLCYVADHEPFDATLATGGDVLASAQDARHVQFLRNADVLIHDAQYTADEYEAKSGWGHSPVDYVVEVGCAAGVDRTVLFHHDPAHDDATVDAIIAHADERAAGRTTIVGAAEGLTLEVVSATRVKDEGSAPPRSAAVLPAEEDLSATVVIATNDDFLLGTVAEAARAEELAVVTGEATDQLASVQRVIAVVDVDEGPDAFERLRSSISPGAWARSGILAVTRTTAGNHWSLGAVTDWLVWPASEAHVRTKLRAAVLRRACRWQAAPSTPDEEARLAALYKLDILDTDAEPRFDRFTEAACKHFNVPISFITLVDRDRQWFKSRRGLQPPESPRDQSMCAHAILGDDVMQVHDLLTDGRFGDNPAAIAERIRFYAGAPLTVDGGYRVGTLCIADHRPRLLAESDLVELRRLAALVAEELQSGT